MTIGQRLRAERERRGWTQAQLANRVETTLNMLVMWEMDDGDAFSPSTQARLARVGIILPPEQPEQPRPLADRLARSLVTRLRADPTNVSREDLELLLDLLADAYVRLDEIERNERDRPAKGGPLATQEDT